MESAALKGLDSLLSTVQIPAGIPVGTLAIGPAGARNAALLAIAILANSRPALRDRLRSFEPNKVTGFCAKRCLDPRGEKRAGKKEWRTERNPRPPQ
jgi:5-(carboxyamino)imidazole ribonucleotide mutase